MIGYVISSLRIVFSPGQRRERQLCVNLAVPHHRALCAAVCFGHTAVVSEFNHIRNDLQWVLVNKTSECTAIARRMTPGFTVGGGRQAVV